MAYTKSPGPSKDPFIAGYAQQNQSCVATNFPLYALSGWSDVSSAIGVHIAPLTEGPPGYCALFRDLDSRQVVELVTADGYQLLPVVKGRTVDEVADRLAEFVCTHEARLVLTASRRHFVPPLYLKSELSEFIEELLIKEHDIEDNDLDDASGPSLDLD